MKYSWKDSRKKEMLPIPQPYQEKTKEQQNRRELTFLIQEAAFSEKVPLFHVLDLEYCTDKEGFRKKMPEAKAVLYFGIPVYDPFLLQEQKVPGAAEHIVTTIAQLKVENYLWNFTEKIEMQGYRVIRVLPVITPDFNFADKISLTGAGCTGRNGRFLCEAFGSKVCMGYLITDAPFMGGDYRDTSIGQFTNPCIHCNICLEECPANAITDAGIDQTSCISNCNKCMEVCPAGDKLPWN